jgi:hypothetical protein
LESWYSPISLSVETLHGTLYRFGESLLKFGFVQLEGISALPDDFFSNPPELPCGIGLIRPTAAEAFFCSGFFIMLTLNIF